MQGVSALPALIFQNATNKYLDQSGIFINGEKIMSSTFVILIPTRA